ncbi:MAG: cytochrome c553 [Cellvibrionaceae bacterium]|jgi:cytochrome c553
MSKNKFLISIAATLLTSLSLSIPVFAATAAVPTDVKRGDPVAGEAQSASCAACHGADGNSPAPSFPKIAGLGEKYLTEQLKLIQTNERAIVEMTGQLDGKSEQDLKDLAAYFNTQVMQISGAKPLEVRVNAGIKVDGIKLGARVWRSGNLKTGVPSCMGCHSPKGLGNEPAGYPRLGGQYSEYIAKQLRAYRGGERVAGANSSIMRQAAEQMSDAEIDAVANFIAGLN